MKQGLTRTTVILIVLVMTINEIFFLHVVAELTVWQRLSCKAGINTRLIKS